MNLLITEVYQSVLLSRYYREKNTFIHYLKLWKVLILFFLTYKYISTVVPFDFSVSSTFKTPSSLRNFFVSFYLVS